MGYGVLKGLQRVEGARMIIQPRIHIGCRQNKHGFRFVLLKQCVCVCVVGMCGMEWENMIRFAFWQNHSVKLRIPGESG